MDIKQTLNKLLSTELELENSSFNEKKLLISLFKESLQGTSEEDDIATDVQCMPPSFFVAASCILAIEDKFNIEITDEEADKLLYEDGRIIDLINFLPLCSERSWLNQSSKRFGIDINKSSKSRI